MLKNRPRTRSLIALAVALGLGFTAEALAADADLQQYNRPSANAENANTADALTGSLLLVRDGKRITADSNGVGSAPINRSVKQIADAVAGTRCGTWGNCTGVNLRTLRAVAVDGAGGASSGVANGTILTSAGGSRVLLQPALVEILKNAAGTAVIDDKSIVWSGTAASGGNPSSSTALKNQLRPLNTPKAWFLVQADGAGNYTVSDGAGISGAAAGAVAGDIDITLTTAMDTTNNAVVVSGLYNGAPSAVAAIPFSATVYKIRFAGGSCGAQSCTVHGVVFGRQTTP